MSENLSSLSLDKRADILHNTFKHYFTMAMDHHTKATTSSQILLIAVGAIIGLVSRGNDSHSHVVFISGVAVYVIGLFGAAWAWKQHERYHYWEHIAYKYEEKLLEIVPGLKARKTYHNEAQKEVAKEFGSLFARVILDRSLWVFLHFIIALIGVALITLWGRGQLWGWVPLGTMLALLIVPLFIFGLYVIHLIRRAIS